MKMKLVIDRKVAIYSTENLKSKAHLYAFHNKSKSILSHFGKISAKTISTNFSSV